MLNGKQERFRAELGVIGDVAVLSSIFFAIVPFFCAVGVFGVSIVMKCAALTYINS